MIHLLTNIFWIYSTLTLPLVKCGIESLPNLYFSTEMAASTFIFKSTEITDMTSCARLCKMYPSCVFVNFRRHGNLCVMSHTNVAMDTIPVTKQRKAEVVSWSKINMDQSGDQNVDVCQPNDPRQECKTLCVNADGFTPAGGTFYGNMIEEGSKIIYKTGGTTDMQMSATCQTTGIWSITQDTTNLYPGFVENTLTDGTTIKYRVFHEGVNYTTAEDRCEDVGATLIQITTSIKHGYFVDLLVQPEYRGAYWFDAHDVNGSWQTSDGQSIPETVIDEYDYFQDCARLALDRNYGGKNIDCSRTYSFICEVRE